MAPRRKKKKSKLPRGWLIEESRGLILVPFTAKDEEARFRETLQRNIVEKHTTHMVAPFEIVAPIFEDWQLPSPTPEPPRKKEDTTTVIRISTKEVSQPEVPYQIPKKAGENTNEEVFHTPYVDDQLVTKTCGAEATINDEENIPAFDVVLDMDSLCGSRVQTYAFDNKQTATIGRKT